MKRIFSIFILMSVLVTFTSCQTFVVNKNKPLQNNSLELYKKYTIQTNDAKTVKMQVLKIDDEKIYGKNNKGEEIVLSRTDIRDVKKIDLVSSIIIGVAAVAAVIFVPI